MLEKKNGGMGIAPHCHHSTSIRTSDHKVQFYDEEEHLHSVLSNYFDPFLVDSEDRLGAIVLARTRTTQYLGDCLLGRKYTCDGSANEEKRQKDSDVESATPVNVAYRKDQRIVFLVDAEIFLAKLVAGDELKAEAFEKMLNELLLQLTSKTLTDSQQQQYHELPIYAYGELVDILCARGQHLLALELESLWNRFLTDSSNISLLCGYKMDSFRDLQVGNVFDQICHSHTAVTPTETYSNLATTEQRLAKIAILQQKAIALHSKQPLHLSSGKAEQRIRYREQFVDTLCHELRNLVSGILGNIELLQVGLDDRQAILHPHQDGRVDDDLRLSNADVVLLRDQLASDLVSVDAIAACAEHMKTISDDVLSLSKLEDGKVVLQRVPFNPKTIITSVVKMFSTLARKKRVQLIADLPTEERLVVGDPGRLAQVIMNLISNAVKFTETGSITVQLCFLGPSLINKGSLIFKVAVRDTGRGLSRDEVSMLFQRFAQPPSTSLVRDGGTGLGLYISKYLVELMGGTIYVESKHGNGSTFIFTFLVKEYSAAEGDKSWLSLDGDCMVKPHNTTSRSSDPAEITLSPTDPLPHRPMMSRSASDSSEWPSSSSSFMPPDVAASDGSATEQQHQQVRHVLVVDDNPINLRILTRMLVSASCLLLSVSTASNGYDAISKLIAFHASASPIDLILMDLDMPFMDGLNATREIRRFVNKRFENGRSVAEEREVRRLGDTPIIGLTGDVREERFAEARRSGMDECIEKPVVKATVLELMHKVARRRWSSAVQ